MSLSVVLYAEGAGETSGTDSRLPPPGEPLADPHLGPAHRLARRAIAQARNVEPAEITFQSALRTRRGRLPRGSDVHDAATVRRLLAFVRVVPGLAIVLVDADGDPAERRRALGKIAVAVPWVHAVAVQEFEGWLVSDAPTASRTLGKTLDTPREPDGLARGEAKALWASWTAALDPEERARARSALADQLDLPTLLVRSRSFARFVDDLRAGRDHASAP